ERLAEVGYGGVSMWNVVHVEDQIEGLREVGVLRAEVAIDPAAQEGRKGLGLLAREQDRQHRPLLILGRKQTDPGEVPFRCDHATPGRGQVLRLLPVERCPDYDDMPAVLDPLHETQNAR